MPKIISEETKYEGPRFNVVQRIYEDENTNKKYVRDSVELLPAAMVLLKTMKLCLLNNLERFLEKKQWNFLQE